MLLTFPFYAKSTKLARKDKNTVGKSVPAWLIADSLNDVYPKSDYIAQIGYGDSIESALAFAENELGKYFEHSVESSLQANENTKTSDGITMQERSLQRKVIVTSSTKLLAVDHTEPYFEKETNQYSICAFIDRKEAWNILNPKLIQAQKSFSNQFDSADNESDPLKKIIRFSQLKPLAESFIDNLDFAAAIYPSGAESYKTEREKAARVDDELTSARMKSVMKIQVNGDYENRIVRCVSGSLAKEKFLLSDNEYAYLVDVNVEPNKIVHEDEENVITAVPGIIIAITNGTENIFTWSKTLKRISGFKDEIVNKKIYIALEKEIEQSFMEEFKLNLK